MVPFERALVSFYRSSIVTFPLSSRVSEILPLLFSSMPFFPTPPLVSPKFLHVLLGVGGSSFGYKERRCWANCPCNQFPRYPTYVITNHQRHRRTEGQTDGRHAIARPRFALCIVHRAVKTKEKQKTQQVQQLYVYRSCSRLLFMSVIFRLFPTSNMCCDFKQQQ